MLEIVSNSFVLDAKPSTATGLIIPQGQSSPSAFLVAFYCTAQHLRLEVLDRWNARRVCLFQMKC